MLNEDNIKYIDDKEKLRSIRYFYLWLSSLCIDENVNQFRDIDGNIYQIENINSEYELIFPSKYIFHVKGVRGFFSSAKTNTLLDNLDPTSDYGFPHIKWYRDIFKSSILFQSYSILLSLCVDNTLKNNVQVKFIAKPILLLFINLLNGNDDDDDEIKYYLEMYI